MKAYRYYYCTEIDYVDGKPINNFVISELKDDKYIFVEKSEGNYSLEDIHIAAIIRCEQLEGKIMPGKTYVYTVHPERIGGELKWYYKIEVSDSSVFTPVVNYFDDYNDCCIAGEEFCKQLEGKYNAR